MRTLPKKKTAKAAYSLVELIVVMAIGTILASLAIPAIARLGAFSADDLGNTTQDLYTMLKAAKVHAATNNTDTAVVYTLDNYNEYNRPLSDPIADSFTGDITRAIIGAAIVSYDKELGVFTPLKVREGNFQRFPDEVVIPLMEPEEKQGNLLYTDLEAHYNPILSNLKLIGMNTIKVNFRVENAEYEDRYNISLPAHTFSPAGQLKVEDSSKERYAFMIAANPNLDPEERLILPDTYFGNPPDITAEELFLSRTISLYRSTGRIKISD